jgi:hypothetical protein
LSTTKVKRLKAVSCLERFEVKVLNLFQEFRTSKNEPFNRLAVVSPVFPLI